MSQKRYIHIVMSKDFVFAAYTRSDLAYAHARTITGLDVVSCELSDQLPEEVREDIYIDEFSEDGDTPVVEVPFDHLIPKDKK